MEHIHKHKKEWMTMIAGTFLTAAGTSLFFTPGEIVCGGVSGLSTVLYHMLSIPIGISYAVMNGFLLLEGIRMLGREL